MSNHLAIAAVSRALRLVVEDAARAAVTGAEVTHVRPGGEPVKTPATGVNVFLYGVTPNVSLRNGDLPSRSGSGQLVQKPTAALDLHYLLSFYGDDAELETQRMLGTVVQALHSRATLSRDVLRHVAQEDAWLAASDVSEAPEAVRFTPVLLNLEELSKLWSVLFQTPYALSVAYQATLVAIEADGPVRATLPVRDRNVYVFPTALPEIEAVENASGAREPITARSMLRLRGSRLMGEVVKVRVGTGGATGDAAAVTLREVLFPLASITPQRLRAGVQGIQVVHERRIGTPAVPHRGEESNVMAFVLRPRIRRAGDDPNAADDALAFTPAAGADPPRIAATLEPVVGKTQHAELLLNPAGDPSRPSYRFPAPPLRSEDGDTVTFDVPGIEAGSYLVRVRIDGAESVLEADASGEFIRPKMVIP